MEYIGNEPGLLAVLRPTEPGSQSGIENQENGEGDSASCTLEVRGSF